MRFVPFCVVGCFLGGTDGGDAVQRNSASTAQLLQRVTRGADPNQKRALEIAAIESARFACADGKNVVDIQAVNDDYCDCEDGSDEPGTAACSAEVSGGGRRFYCENARFKGMFIPSSKVDDGVCDCCDGSDEWGGTYRGGEVVIGRGGSQICVDSCEAFGASYRQTQYITRRDMLAGLKVKDSWVRAAASRVSKADKEIDRLRDSVRQLEEAIEGLKERERSLQNKRNSARDRSHQHHTGKDQLQQPVHTQTTTPRPLDVYSEFAGSSSSSSSSSSPPSKESPPPAEVDDNALRPDDRYGRDGNNDVDDEKDLSEYSQWMSRQDEGDEETDSDDNGEDNIADDLEDRTTETVTSSSELMPSFDSEEDDAEPGGQEGAHVVGETTQLSEGGILRGVKGWLVRTLSQIRERFSKGPDTLTNVRMEKDRMQGDLIKRKKRLNDLEKAEEAYRHADGRFHMVVNKCFDLRKDQYLYEICLFSEARQVEGTRKVRLGNFTHLSEDNKTMFFENGEQCWSGPRRSISIHFECGAVTQVLDVSEVQRCVYSARVKSPAACVLEEIEALFPPNEEL